MVTLSNRTDHQIVVDLGQDNEQVFVFTITSPDGKITRKQFELTEGLHRTGKETIEPLTTYRQELVINKWYSFEFAGTYEVSITMKAEVLTEPAQYIEAKCDHPIVIEAANPEQVGHEAQQLLEIITRSTTFNEASAAATKLTLITDPVVVQYLADGAAATNIQVAPILIGGLAKVGNDEAVDALFRLTASGDQPKRMMAVNALEYLKSTEHDPGLRRKIELGLQALTREN